MNCAADEIKQAAGDYLATEEIIFSTNRNAKTVADLVRYTHIRITLAELEAKTCNRCQTRENMKPVPSAGNHVTSAKREKTCNRCQARENM